jgi:uncharacterized delta-60 repeat protein
MGRISVVAAAAVCTVICSGICEAQNFALTRYRWGGDLDTTFGDQGRVATTFPTTDDAELTDVAIDGDRIVAVGRAGMSVALARYTWSGALDRRFGGDGRVLSRPVGSSSEILLMAEAVALKNGKIIVAGSAGTLSSVHMFVMRYNDDGSPYGSWLYPDFTSLGCFDSEALAVAVDSNNRIVVGGTVYCDGGWDPYLAVVRYTWDGKLDPTFAQQGRFILNIGPQISGYQEERITDLVVDSAGHIVATGYLYYSGFGAPSHQWLALKLLANGAPDASFRHDASLDGVAVVSSSGRGYGVASLDGRVLAAGYTRIPWFGTNTLTRFTVVRLLSDGSLDTSFGDDGIAVAPFRLSLLGSDSGANSITTDGTVTLAAGWVGPASDRHFALAQFDPDGTLSSWFGNQGMVVTDFTCQGSETANVVRVQQPSSGLSWRIVVGGTANGFPCPIQ